MLTLTPAERSALRARAHALKPVVSIAEHGLTEAVLKEIDRGLKAHELIKVRTYGYDRVEREALLQALCDALGAAPVQHIGKILVAWRPRPPKAPKPSQAVPKRAPSKKTPARAGQPTKPARAGLRARAPQIPKSRTARSARPATTRRRPIPGR